MKFVTAIFSCFLFYTLCFILYTPVFADNEFSSSYDIHYDVDQTGITTVTEKVTLKNLTDRFYASSFNLSIGATNISDIAATDSQGPLEVSSQNQGKKTAITVKFSQQVAGAGKEYPFTFVFRSKDFAQAQGKIWQVSIPKISSPGNLDKYQLTLSVPVAFGDPTSILPEPSSQSESSGKINFNFTKEQLIDSGILANFGATQIFNFTLYYYLENTGILPEVKQVVLPSNSNYQKINLFYINPQPENTFFDQDGNTIAQFKLDKNEKSNIEIKGQALLSYNPNQQEVLTSQQQKQYLASQNYWEKDSPLVSGKLNEIFKEKNPAQSTAGPVTVSQKAKLINHFVVSSLSYDQDRVKNNDFKRLGALTVLNNPNQALCQEFADLFVTLARAAGIPARELTGYAYSSNTDIRPLSLRKDLLHAWAEYFDPNSGWVMVDPTWENTTGGVDYFTKFDLNHLTLAIRGQSSEKPDPPSDIRVEFGDKIATPSGQLKLQIIAPDELFAAFPSKIKLQIRNENNIATSAAKLSIHSHKLNLTNAQKELGQEFNTSSIPPFGRLEYEFSVSSTSPVESFEDTIEVKYGDQVVTKKVFVKPFFAFNLFSLGIMGLFVVMVGIYLFTLVFHLKFHHHLQPVKKKS